MLILCDFDGTVTCTDTLNHLGRRFAPEAFASVGGKLMSGELDLRQVLTLEMQAIREEHATVVEEAVRSVPLRPGFTEFVEWTRDEGHRLVLVSAGFHELIEPMLAAARVTGVPLVANRVTFGPGGGLATFREADSCAVCGEQCKRSDAARLGPADEPFAYIGDGFSDRCAALQAQVVCARDGLAAWLDSHEREYHYFEDFFDVRRALSGALSA